MTDRRPYYRDYYQRNRERILATKKRRREAWDDRRREIEAQRGRTHWAENRHVIKVARVFGVSRPTARGIIAGREDHHDRA